MSEHIYTFMALMITGIPLGVGAYIGWELAELVSRIFRTIFRAKPKVKGNAKIKIDMDASHVLQALDRLSARCENVGLTHWREVAEAQSTIDEAHGKPHHD